MLKIFLSYASEDRVLVRPYFDRLQKLGFHPWMDSESIMPGNVWYREIDQAFIASDIYVLFMSPRSVNKRGFVQKEARDAIAKLRYAKEGDITVIPVRLEVCDVPNFIANEVQYVDLDDAGWERVLHSLRIAAQQRDIALVEGEQFGPVKVYEESIVEEWDGKPGYDVNLTYPRFEFPSNPKLALEINKFFAGRTMAKLLDARSVLYEQNESEEAFWADGHNSIQESSSVTLANDEMISVVTQTWEFNVGAAHGNTYFRGDTFSISNRLVRLSLEGFFANTEAALALISAICIEKLKQEHLERTDETPSSNDVESFQLGAGADWDNFNDIFTIDSKGFVFLFPPYQVACYAMGSWSVEISYEELKDVLADKPYLHSLKASSG